MEVAGLPEPMLTRFPGIPSAPDSRGMDLNPAVAYLTHLPSAQSRRAMRTALNNLAVLAGVRPVVQTEVTPNHREKSHDVTYLACDWAALTPQRIATIRSRLMALYKPASVNKILSALRGVLRAAYSLQLMSAEAYQQAVQVRGVRNKPELTGRDLSEDDIQQLTRVCKADKTPAGARDAAMIGVWYACGLRRSELVRLDLADFDATTGKLIVRNADGNKTRTVYLANGALLALQAWLVDRGQDGGPLFCAIDKAGKLLYHPMSAQAAYKRLKIRGVQAGVMDFSPHDFRRTFVGDMLDAGADIATVAKLAGHASVTTTERYDRRTEETKRKAASLLHFPF